MYCANSVLIDFAKTDCMLETKILLQWFFN
jgi:hypothetical protein